MNPATKEALLKDKKECENAILALMRDESSDHLYIRSILERWIYRIDAKLEEHEDVSR